MACNVHLGARMGWHSFRRGKASDLLQAGTSIAEICRMGGWRSAAVLKFIAIDELQKRLSAIRLIEASDSED